MTDRRAFLTAVTGLVSLSSIASAQRQSGPSGRGSASTEWDLTWLDQLKGKHKQVFDLGTFDLGEDTPLRIVTNYVDAMRDVLHAEGADVNVAVGVSRVAFPLNASDAIWQKYKLGERWKINDPQTGKPSERNFFFSEPNRGGQPVRALQARGAVFWQCNMALASVVQELSRATSQDPAAVRAELIAGFNPGVKLVPAHTFMIGVVQERGFTYEKV